MARYPGEELLDKVMASASAEEKQIASERLVQLARLLIKVRQRLPQQCSLDSDSHKA